MYRPSQFSCLGGRCAGLLLAWFAFLSPAIPLSAADDPRTTRGLTVTLDRSAAPVGSAVTLTLGYRLPPGGRTAEKPEIGGLEDLTILGRETGPDQIRLRILVDRLDAVRSGELTLPYTDAQGTARALTSDAVVIAALSTLGEEADEAQLGPLQDIVPLRGVWVRHLPWAAGAMGLLAAAAALMRLRARRDRRQDLAPREPPSELAQRELERLLSQGFLESGRIKEFYSRLSEILRRYWASIRGFPAAEFTTEEIAWRLGDERDRSLVALLRQADLVKFAEAIPTADRGEEQLLAALAYIRETSPPPATAVAGVRSGAQ